jgi:hypothetical protein
MHADGTHQHRSTRTPRLDESDPRWSPGGTRIAYVRRGQAFATQLFESNADGTCTKAITCAGDDARDAPWYSLPAWLPASDARERPLRCS